MKKRAIIVAAAAVVSLACPGGGGTGRCPEPEVLSGTLSGEVVVGLECSNWSVPSSVFVPTDAKLVIEPGTTLTFGAGAVLQVDGGKLEALGTEELPIVLTGAETTPGFWSGVVLRDASSTENRLSYVTIEFGGAKDSRADAKAAVTLVGSSTKPSRLELKDSTIRNASGFALTLDAHSRLPGFSNNQLTGNSEGAAAVHPMSVGELTADNAYSGNTRDRVVVRGGEILSGEATFHPLAVPFHTGSLDVYADGVLRIEAGATLAFESGARVRLDDGGKLIAAGSAESPILLTAVEPTPGFWQGILVRDAGSTENVLAHATVEFAGVLDIWATSPANVALTHATARLEIRDTVLRSSAGYGLYVDGRATLVSDRNTFTGNALGAVHAFAGSAHFLDAGSHYVDNADGRDFVRVDKGTLSVNATWQALDVPYLLDEVTVTSQLTIAPAATVEFEAGKFLRIDDAGRLTAVGTDSERIVFRGRANAAWVGLLFKSTLQDNRVEYADVTNAGNGSWTWSEPPHGAARVYQSKLSVANSRFINNQGYGVWQSNSAANVTGCGSAIFEGNSAGTSNLPCP